MFYIRVHHNSIPVTFLIFALSSCNLRMATRSREGAAPAIFVERNAPKSRLLELGVKSWPKWGCSPGKYLLSFDAQETCYLVKGKVKAYAKESSQSVEFGAGDIVVIPKGLSCTWEILVPIDKHYKFDSS